VFIGTKLQPTTREPDFREGTTGCGGGKRSARTSAPVSSPILATVSPPILATVSPPILAPVSSPLPVRASSPLPVQALRELQASG
jgi:hypothetical protein